MQKTIKNKYSQTKLLPKNPFLKGMGSIFNIFGNYYYNFTNPEEQDVRDAIASYWKTTGEYIYTGIEQLDKNEAKHTKSSSSTR